MPIRKFFTLLVILALWAPALVQAKPKGLLDGVEEFTLDNGMKFLLLKRQGAPVFSAYIRIKAGGVDEEDGKTGIAHLLEHMAFKGTSTIGTRDHEKEKVLLAKLEVLHDKKLQTNGATRQQLEKQMQQVMEEASELVVKEEFSKIYQRNGATGLNATTSQDLTSYFVTLPNTKLELWAYLESSRLKDPVFREFYSERQVVGEERRMRVEDSPFGKLYESFIQLSFDKSPYRRPTIGFKEDIQKLSATDLKEFYQKYYVPSNAVGAIVGNIDLPETKRILKEYFGDWSPGNRPSEEFPEEPKPTKPKTETVPFDAKPALAMGYLKPNMPHPDDYVFDVLDAVLCRGRTARLYKRWVIKERIAQGVNCSPSTPGSRLDNLFFIYAAITTGVAPEKLIQSFDDELEKIIKEGVDEKELKKAKKSILSQWYFDLSSNSDLAEALSYFEAVGGDWRYILNHQKKIQAVKSKDIVRVIKEYMTPEKRRWAYLKPEGKGAAQ